MTAGMTAPAMTLLGEWGDAATGHSGRMRRLSVVVAVILSGRGNVRCDSNPAVEGCMAGRRP